MTVCRLVDTYRSGFDGESQWWLFEQSECGSNKLLSECLCSRLRKQQFRNTRAKTNLLKHSLTNLCARKEQLHILAHGLSLTREETNVEEVILIGDNFELWKLIHKRMSAYIRAVSFLLFTAGRVV